MKKNAVLSTKAGTKYLRNYNKYLIKKNNNISNKYNNS